MTGSGSLGGTSFTNQLITLTGTGNTTSVTNVGGGIYVVLTSTTVQVDSGSVASFTDTIQAVDNQSLMEAGFGDASSNLAVLFTTAPAFGSYNLMSSTTGTGPAGYNSGAAFATTAGSFIINSVSGNSTFTGTLASSTVTPEPSGLSLLGTGAMGLAGLVRRRLKRETKA